MVSLGAEPISEQYNERPLEVSKDKFSRSVLQNLNDAATQGNSNDLGYLVSCGNKIDDKMSITGEAPIHKAVLSTTKKEIKCKALETIITCEANLNIIDANGWTALHHAAYTGDLESVKIIISKGALVNAYSNQGRTPLHFAAM